MNKEVESRKKILLSESPQLLALVRESILQTSQVQPRIASGSQEIMALVHNWQPHLMILGPLEIASICQTLKSSKEHRDIPLIAIVPRNDAATLESVLAAGCDEWVSTPLDEDTLLGKIQDLVGIRFRKLPRYAHNAPALVTFKGKDFPSQSIDINRRMIFLESKEGLAPATGRNVKLNFQLTNEEPIACWGRVVKLMARKIPHENKETIGMLIRFLDLPPNAARRIDQLAKNQSHHINTEDDIDRSQYPWLEMEDYEKLATILDEQSDAESIKTFIPPKIFASYLSTLSDKEKTTLSITNGSSLIKKSVLARIRLLEEIAKFRHGIENNKMGSSLRFAEGFLSEIQNEINQQIQNGADDQFLFWSKVKLEILRNKLEIETLQYGQSDFAQTLKNKESTTGHHHIDWKAFLLGAFVMMLFFLTPRVFQVSDQQMLSTNINKEPLQKAGITLEPIRDIHFQKLGIGQWNILNVSLNQSWVKMPDNERMQLSNDIFNYFQNEGVRQIFFYDPAGRLIAGVINKNYQEFSNN